MVTAASNSQSDAPKPANPRRARRCRSSTRTDKTAFGEQTELKIQNAARRLIRAMFDLIGEFMDLHPPYRQAASFRTARVALQPEWGARLATSMHPCR